MKNRFFGFTSALFALSLVPVFGLTPGCGGASASGVCQEICACQGCTTKDLNDCEDEEAAAAEKADEAGCGGEFDDYVVCLEDNLSCRDENAADKACNGILEQVNGCMKGTGIIFGDPCKAAANHLAECVGADVGGGDGGDCKGNQACTAACINAASCDALNELFNGQQGPNSQPVLDCLTSCSNNSSGSGGIEDEPPSPGTGGAGGVSSGSSGGVGGSSDGG